MIKSLALANRSERQKFRIPRSVQDTVPVRCVYPDGIFLAGGRHSKSWRLSDVNYAAASDEERKSIFLSYGAVLNSLPTDAAAKITIINRRLNPADFERSILMDERWDGLDEYRAEAVSGTDDDVIIIDAERGGIALSEFLYLQNSVFVLHICFLFVS